jgi:hypothetical protein
LDYSAFSKAKVASYFDSHKTNFTEIDLIPIESTAQYALLSISAQELLKKGITPTNPISNDLKQINMKPNFTYKI